MIHTVSAGHPLKIIARASLYRSDATEKPQWWFFLVVFAKLFAKQTVYKPPSKQAVGFVSKTLRCTLFWAYTIVPSNVPLPDCKSDMFSFWTSMPPDETVICNQMNDKLMKNQNQQLPSMSTHACNVSFRPYFEVSRSRNPLHTLCTVHVVKYGAYLEMRWKK